MLSREPLRKADVVTSMVLGALGACVIAGALGMPLSGTYGGIEIQWYTSPAVFPLLLGVSLVLGAVAVLVRALVDGGHHQLNSVIASVVVRLPKNRVAHRALLIWGLMLAYILSLSFHPLAGAHRWFVRISGSSLTAFLSDPEGANYVLSSFFFLALFMRLFHRPAPPGWTWGRSVVLISACLGVAWCIGYLFTQHLYSPLPW